MLDRPSQRIGQRRPRRRAAGRPLGLFELHLGHLDRSDQLVLNRLRLLAGQAFQLGQERFHASFQVGPIDPVILQVIEHAEDVRGHSFAAMGQALGDLTLREFRAAKPVDIQSAQPTNLPGLHLESHDLSPRLALQLERAGQLGQDRRLPGREALDQRLGRDDQKPPRRTGAFLAGIIGRRRQAGQLHPGPQIQLGQRPAVIDRATLARLRGGGHAARLGRPGRSAIKHYRTTGPLRNGPRNLNLPHRQVVLRRDAKRHDRPRCGYPVGGRTLDRHRRRPVGQSAIVPSRRERLDAVLVQQPQPVRARLLQDERRRPVGRDDQVNAVAGNLGLDPPTLLQAQLGLDQRLVHHGAEFHSHPSQGAKVHFARLRRPAGILRRNQPHGNRLQLRGIEHLDLVPRHRTIVARLDAERERSSNLLPANDQGAAEQLDPLFFAGDRAVRVLEPPEDLGLGRKPGAVGVDHFHLEGGPAGQTVHRFAEIQVRHLRPGDVAPRSGQPHQRDGGRPRIGNHQNQGNQSHQQGRQDGVPGGTPIDRLVEVKRLRIRHELSDHRATQRRRAGPRILLRLPDERDRTGKRVTQHRKPPLQPLGHGHIRPTAPQTRNEETIGRPGPRHRHRQGAQHPQTAVLEPDQIIRQPKPHRDCQGDRNPTTQGVDQLQPLDPGPQRSEFLLQRMRHGGPDSQRGVLGYLQENPSLIVPDRDIPVKQAASRTGSTAGRGCRGWGSGCTSRPPRRGPWSPWPRGCPGSGKPDR